MNITITVNDLQTLVDALNNAIIAYRDIRNVISVCGCYPQNLDEKWEPLIGDSFETATEVFDKRLTALNQVYTQLLEMEKIIKAEEDKR